MTAGGGDALAAPPRCSLSRVSLVFSISNFDLIRKCSVWISLRSRRSRASFFSTVTAPNLSEIHLDLYPVLGIEPLDR